MSEAYLCYCKCGTQAMRAAAAISLKWLARGGKSRMTLCTHSAFVDQPSLAPYRFQDVCCYNTFIKNIIIRTYCFRLFVLVLRHAGLAATRHRV